MLNRTLCDVFEEIRAMYKTRNFSGLLGLIEEAQSMGNRMEAALGDQKDLKSLLEKKIVAKKELKDIHNIVKKAHDTAEEQDLSELKDNLKKVLDIARPKYGW